MKKLSVLFALCFCVLSISAQSPLIHYDFDNGHATDLSGNGYHGTTSAVPCADRHGNPNQALHFNGIDQIYQLPNVSALKP